MAAWLAAKSVSWLAAGLLATWLAAGLAGCEVGELARCWAAGCLAGSRPTLPLLFFTLIFVVDLLSLHQS